MGDERETNIDLPEEDQSISYVPPAMIVDRSESSRAVDEPPEPKATGEDVAGKKDKAGEETSGKADEQKTKEKEEAPAKKEGEKTGEEPAAEGKTKFQKRIDQLVRQREDLRRELEEARRQIEARPKRTAEEKAQKDPRPEQDDFDSYDDYVVALSRWAARREREEEPTHKETPAEEKTPGAQDPFTQYSRRVKAAGKKLELEDFEDVAFDRDLPVSEAMAEAIMETEPDVGARILYELGQDFEKAYRIAQLSPGAAAREIIRMEMELESPPPKKKPSTKAPEPIKPGKPGGGSPDKPPEEMTNAEYRRWREKQIREEGA